MVAHPQGRFTMISHLPRTVLAIWVAAAPFASLTSAQAKQQCSAAAPPDHGYWSWRLIDGRKCWYEGKPMLSKSLLEWPAQSSGRADSSGQASGAVQDRGGDPLDAQAWAPAASNTFDAMWRDRIEQH